MTPAGFPTATTQLSAPIDEGALADAGVGSIVNPDRAPHMGAFPEISEELGRRRLARLRISLVCLVERRSLPGRPCRLHPSCAEMAGMSPSSLPFFDDSDVQRVLCVVAHPDDMEYGASAAVARWTALGIEVSYLLLTAGEAGMRSRRPEEAGPLRAEEQRAACAAVGVEDLTILDLPDGTLEASLQTRRHIARHIRRVRPDVVVTQPWEVYVDWGLNQADHRVAGLATADAVRDADNPWVFRDLMTLEGLEPWAVSWLLVPNSPEPNRLINVSGAPLEQAVKSLEAHAEYLAELGGDFSPRGMLEEITSTGARLSRVTGIDNALPAAAFPMS